MTNVERTLAATAVASAAFLIAVAAHAHDFWLVPDAFVIAEGSAFQVRGQTSSRFPTSESAVAVARVAEARLLGASDEELITDMSQAGASLVLRHRPSGRGQRIVAVTLHPRSIRESAAGFRRYLELEGAPEALDRVDREGLLAGRDSVTRRYAKYAKTLVEVGRGGPRAFSRTAGHPLEFHPLRDPSELRPGDSLALRVVYRGRSLAGARVHAGYVAALSSPPPTAAAASVADAHLTANADGVIRVAITSAGLWNVRMIHVAQADPGSGADWDTHWATLVFQVGRTATGQTVGVRESMSDSGSVAAVVDAFHGARANGDSLSAMSLLAAYAVIMESGGVETREEYRSHHLPGDMAFARAIRSSRGAVHVTIHGDVAWTTSTSTTVGTYRDRAINSAGAELMVLTRTPEGWRIRAIHWSSRARRTP
ncbi:MAG: DUF4198 domain-containing protein [Gemmatimonadaceae bacterium]